MSRFEVGDRVRVLPQYARLYLANRGVVLSVKPDELGRHVFDKYLIEFSPNARKEVFDFRLTSDAPSLKTIRAQIAPHSSQVHVRGVAAQETVLQTRDMDIHLATIEYQDRTCLMGQILEKSSSRLLGDVEVRLFQENNPVGIEATNDLGEFQFSSVPEGALTIEILLGPNLSRVIGTFIVARSETA